MTLKNETIVDRVVERLRKQPLGDLITEEDLHDIVKEAIPRTFFEKRARVENPGAYNSRTVYEEPLILEVMRDLLKDAAREAVDWWMVANAPMIEQHWNEVMKQGLLNHVQALQNEKATRHIEVVLRKWFDEVNQERSRAGLPPFGYV